MHELEILAALFIDDIDLRQVEGPSTRIDLGGIQFSAPLPTDLPYNWAPHLVVLVRAPEDHSGEGVLEAVFTIAGEQVARNVQPLQIEPGKFGYRLVRAEVEVTEPTTVEALVRIDRQDPLTVPYTFLPSVPASAS